MQKTTSIVFYSSSIAKMLRTALLCAPQHSYSPILVLGSFLSEKCPELLPQNQKVIKPTSIGLYNIWCDYLANKLNYNTSQEKQNHITLLIQSSNQFVMKLDSAIFVECGPRTAPTTIRKKIGLANLSTSVLSNEMNKPKFQVQGLIKGIFHRNGYEWQTYKVVLHQLPTKEQLRQFDAFIISGSSLSINSKTAVVSELQELLKEHLPGKESRLKLLGICFGHQALANVAGSNIETKQLIARLQQINFNEDLIKSVPFLRSLQSESLFSEFHCDHLRQLPLGFHLLGSSNSCKVEAMVSVDHRILTFQYHPEYSLEYLQLLQRQWHTYISATAGKQTIKHYQQIKYDFQYHQRSMQNVREAINMFIEADTATNVQHTL